MAVQKFCLICGTKFFDESKNYAKDTCSPKCRHEYYKTRQSFDTQLDRLIDLRINVLKLKGCVIHKEDRDEIKIKLKIGVCDICGCKTPVRKLHIDHDHVNNRYRGVLCANCNILLGMARDSVDILTSSIAYLYDRMPTDQMKQFGLFDDSSSYRKE